MRKIQTGTVLSAKMDKTRVVGVETWTVHTLYNKRIRRLKKYYVHDAENMSQEGDHVEIIETRPISKSKRWRLSRVISE